MSDHNSLATVSAIIPTYNEAELVVAAVKSALQQSWPSMEVIVIDDGSTDDTRALLEPLSNRIRYVFQSNAGRPAARNRGLALATGEFVAFLDADDVWYPEKIARQLAGLKRHPEAGWAYCRAHLTDQKGTILKSSFWPDSFGTGQIGVSNIEDALMAGNLEIHTSTIVVRRDLLRSVGNFDESLATAQDTNMWIRIAHLSPILFMEETLATWRLDTSVVFMDRMQSYNYAVNGLRARKNSLEAIGIDLDSSLVAQGVLRDAYLESALIEFGNGRTEEGQGYWAKAIPAEAPDPYSRLPKRLASFAIANARYDPMGPARAERNLEAILSQLPLSTREQSKIATAAYCEMYDTVSYMYQLKGQRYLAAKFAWKSLLSGTTKWSNRGLWKRAFGAPP